MKRLLQGAEVWRDGGFVRADVLVDGDRIAAVGLGLPAEGCEVVPLGGMKILPGLVDVHVHLREPGFTAKESVVSTLTVLLGGDTAALTTLFTPFTGIVFLVFTLLYTPCVAAIAAVKRELGGARAAAGVVLMQCGIAWIVAFVVHCVGTVFGLV